MNVIAAILFLLFMFHPATFGLLVLVFVLFILYFISEWLFWIVLISLVAGVVYAIANSSCK